MSINENLQNIKESISRISLKYGRDPMSVELLAVSKTKPLPMLIEAYNAGQRLFGENRVNEAEIKVQAMPDDSIFHMIGHLQGNKVKKACHFFSCIQSVDSLKIARKIQECCRDIDKVMDIYLDINIVNDPNKTGFIVNDDFYMAFEEILKMKNIRVLGLMCIGAHVEDSQIIKKSFCALKVLSEELLEKYQDFNGRGLSMGMSGDFEEAISQGSTIVRIGSSIFGDRI